ncbi:MAG: HIT family protein [Austwickia sp.]|nr:HIT family protein [Austwickia sp.]MBK8435522.1 HIT family protein [Austwickia sp.]MBK9100906.1 HIT family protein [Austwickia sp.]
MPTVFSRILAGEIPARFVWRDERCAAFLTAAPLTDGHVLVVPFEEVPEWTAADDDLLGHLSGVARRIGATAQALWSSPRVGLLCQGFEVPHLHLHVWPAFSGADFELRRADPDPDPAHQDAVASRLRAALRAAGYQEFVPGD